MKKKECPGKGKTFDETKRDTCILGLVWMIDLSPKRFLRRDLDGHFEISERMIQKDLDVIRHGLKYNLQRTPQDYFGETEAASIHISRPLHSKHDGTAILRNAPAA